MKRSVVISPSRRARVAAIELYATTPANDLSALTSATRRKAALCGLRSVDLATTLADLSCHIVTLIGQGARI